MTNAHQWSTCYWHPRACVPRILPGTWQCTGCPSARGMSYPHVGISWPKRPWFPSIYSPCHPSTHVYPFIHVPSICPSIISPFINNFTQLTSGYTSISWLFNQSAFHPFHIYPPVYQFIMAILSTNPSYLHIDPSTHLTTYPQSHPLILPSIHLFSYINIYLSCSHLFTYTPIHPSSINSSVCLFSSSTYHISTCPSIIIDLSTKI